MSGSCGVCVDGVLYLFGGHHARGNTNRVQMVCCVNQMSRVNDDWILKALSCGTPEKSRVCCRFTGFPWEPPALFGRKWGTWKDFLHPARTSLAAGFTRIGERCGCMLMNFCKLVLIDRQTFRTPLGKDSVPKAEIPRMITNFQKKIGLEKLGFLESSASFQSMLMWGSGCP